MLFIIYHFEQFITVNHCVFVNGLSLRLKLALDDFLIHYNGVYNQAKDKLIV